MEGGARFGVGTPLVPPLVALALLLALEAALLDAGASLRESDALSISTVTERVTRVYSALPGRLYDMTRSSSSWYPASSQTSATSSCSPRTRARSHYVLPSPKS